jgi:hypothetical protein
VKGAEAIAEAFKANPHRRRETQKRSYSREVSTEEMSRESSSEPSEQPGDVFSTQAYTMQGGPPRKELALEGEGTEVVGHRRLFLVGPEHSSNRDSRGPVTLRCKCTTDLKVLKPRR